MSDPSPDKNDPSPGKNDPSPDKNDPSPDKNDPSPDKNDPSPDKNDPSSDKNDPSSPAPEGKPRVIKIGSQRPGHEPRPATPPSQQPTQLADSSVAAEVAPSNPAHAGEAGESAPAADEPSPAAASETLTQHAPEVNAAFPPPRVERMSNELQQEIDDVLDGLSLEDLLGDATGPAKSDEPQIDERYPATVVKIHREDIFFALPGHYEGVGSLRQFDEVPEVGAIMDVVVNKFNSEQGLYELSVPGASVSVQDWSDLDVGIVVEAKITAHNSGGLECEVNGIRGFIPVSQISLYRVEDLEQFVGEKFHCIVNEANPARGNLVLSRRAVLEREQAAEKEKLLKTLEVGQVREGIVRKIMDFGAFVDLGGVDGLIHISKLSWDRVKHPSEVLEEGQKVQVKVEKIDTDSGRIGLSFRDLIEHPWEKAAETFSENAIVTGTVSKIMDFGAFVRLAAGIEGLVHISELAHHRVVRVSNVVTEGEEVTVKVLAVDPESQRISLSMKAVVAPPVDAKASEGQSEPADEPPRERATKPHQGTLKGGTNKKSGGEQFGLNW